MLEAQERKALSKISLRAPFLDFVLRKCQVMKVLELLAVHLLLEATYLQRLGITHKVISLNRTDP